MRVIVVGGGVMGTLCALRLSQTGAEVLVLERSVPGAEASSAAAGILAPAFEGAHVPRPAEVVPFGIASRELHADLADELRQNHAIDNGFRRHGVMAVAFQDEDPSHLDRLSDLLTSLGLPQDHTGALWERVDGAEARKREPELADDVQGAIDFGSAAQLEPKKLLTGVAIAAERAGARFRQGAVVHAVRGADDGTEGVPEVDLGTETLRADHVIVAAGSWTSLIAGLPKHTKVVQPVRGQIVQTVSRPPLFRRIMFGAGGYLLTRPTGEVLCGSTEERVGFRRGVTFSGMSTILQMAQRVAPRLAQAEVQAHWSSFRPGTPDELPLIGAAGPKGLWLASGHYRNGILQAPITADILTRALTGDAPSPFAELVDPRRLA